ncbi:acyl-CoA thioesterase [Nocardioides alcanivorans]|uniref:acyl-CoA thioesterase n=1 Tax=Nocardioides alcanivorans TaxID=2897352 RepID=UPI001F243A91|nr:hotdog domain-containing protein [Nocardioides alcanivorans]
MTGDVRRTPAFSEVSLATLMHATEANLLGNVHGGAIMKLADSTAGAAARRHAGGAAVTAAMDEMLFLEPVHVGDIVRTSARVNWAGRTSMEVGVRVEAEPWGAVSQTQKTVATAYFVFVAIDEEGRSRSVPPLVPETDLDRRRWREAEIRRANRLARRQEIEAGRAPEVP